MKFKTSWKTQILFSSSRNAKTRYLRIDEGTDTVKCINASYLVVWKVNKYGIPNVNKYTKIYTSFGGLPDSAVSIHGSHDGISSGLYLQFSGLEQQHLPRPHVLRRHAAAAVIVAVCNIWKMPLRSRRNRLQARAGHCSAQQRTLARGGP